MQTLSQVGCYENSCIEKNRAPEKTLFLPSDPIHDFRQYLNQSKDPREIDLQNNEAINKICESFNFVK